ncbi:MAG: LEA type 2 family protein [candidate division WOR-3 bacterium]
MRRRFRLMLGAGSGRRLAVGILLACLVLGSGCATFLSSTTGAILLQLAPVGLELFEVPAKLDLKVTNPSKLTATVSDIKYEVLIAGSVVASGEQQAPVTLSGEGSQVISVPLSVKPGSVLSSVKSSLASKSVKYQVRGSYAIAATSEQTFTASSLLKSLMARSKE